MKIQIKYFASLREQTHKTDEILEFKGNNVQELWEMLSEKYHLEEDLQHLKVAINDEYADLTDRLQDNDLVVFIPPVAGG